MLWLFFHFWEKYFHMNRKKKKRRKSDSDKLRTAALVLAIVREITALVRELIE